MKLNSSLLSTIRSPSLQNDISLNKFCFLATKSANISLDPDRKKKKRRRTNFEKRKMVIVLKSKFLSIFTVMMSKSVITTIWHTWLGGRIADMGNLRLIWQGGGKVNGLPGPRGRNCQTCSFMHTPRHRSYNFVRSTAAVQGVCLKLHQTPCYNLPR